MLSLLKIENLAIVEKVELELSHGLNIITGETGAGKSIVLKAVSLLCGARVMQEIVREAQGVSQCEVEGLFILPEKTRGILIEEFGISEDLLQGDELIVRRSISRAGRSRSYINGKLAPLSQIQGIAPFLISVTGQHDQKTLRDATYHRSILDSFGVDETLRRSVKETFLDYYKCKKRIR